LATQPNNRYIKSRDFHSAEIIGALPGCIDMVADNLNMQGLSSKVTHINGTIKQYNQF